MKLNKKNFFIGLGILLFLLQPILLPSRPTSYTEPQFIKELAANILGNCIIIVFFFLNYKYFIPKFLFTKKYFSYAIIVLVGLVIVLAVPYLLFGSPEPPTHDDFMPKPPHEDTFFENFRLFFSNVDQTFFMYFGTVFFTAFWFERIQSERIKNEKLQAELSHLKLQIHPHFLFNTLNSIYSSAIKKDDKAAESIIVFSDFIRYLLQDSYQKEVSLEKEVHYISNYISLQKERLRNTVDIDYVTQGNFSERKIAPLILFTFIENAFKYGVNPEENSKIKIEIYLLDHEVKLLVSNKIVSIQNGDSSNIGINNAKERLNIFYPKQHELYISQEQDNFLVDLQIVLQ